jgi:hypothetical protein
MKRQFETMSGPGNIPVLRYQNRTYQLLNLGLDIEMDGVTYHLSSQYADKGEMGAVIDMIEQERNQRNSA